MSNSNKKTLAKANGLKSTIIANDKVYLTSFGKGNKAVLEKEVKADFVEDINTIKPNFTAAIDDVNEKKLQIKGRYSKKTALAEKPTSTTPRQDAIGAKSALEKIYFGQEFNDDNIHIQICYNILDIYKIFSVHANNITFEIDNLIRNAGARKNSVSTQNVDYIGEISLAKKWEALKEDRKNAIITFLKSPYTTYLGELFQKSKKEEFDNYIVRCYLMMALMGTVRQTVNHFRIAVDQGQKDKRLGWIFDIANPEYAEKEVLNLLDEVYDDRFSKIKADFIKTAGKDVQIIRDSLRKIFPEKVDTSYQSYNDIAKRYFDFVEMKNYKNIGFSIKKLRETMLEMPEASELKSDRFDSVRARLYRTIDFIINYYYTVVNKDGIEYFVSELRSTLSEEDKEFVYKKNARFLLENVFRNELKLIGNTVFFTSKDKNAGGQLKKSEYYIKLPNGFSASYFSKLIYFMTTFLDGKEINDLTTTLINKFSNINSLIKTAKEINVEIDFEDEYKIFNEGYKVSKELNFIKSIARMQPKLDPSARKIQYLDALDILGIPNDMTKEEIEAFADEFLKVDDENGKTLRGKHDFRNFIAGNVINSSRFSYIVRYNSAKETRKLIKNIKLVKFVLGRMDEKQIDRYYSACHFEGNNTLEAKIDKLATTLQEIDFTIFKDVNNKANATKKGDKEGEKKARYQTVVSLYLTVLYQVVKNLIYVNSRYVIAFGFYQRDIFLLKEKYNLSKNKTENDQNIYTELPKIFYKEKLLNKHFSENLRTNFQNLTEMDLDDADSKTTISYNAMLDSYRNNIAHISVVSEMGDYIKEITKIDSYFSLYHSIMQSLLLKKTSAKEEEKLSILEKQAEKVKECFKNVESYHYYSKDLLNMLNLPFAYNISRYKSLSIADLFDRNNVQNGNTK